LDAFWIWTAKYAKVRPHVSLQFRRRFSGVTRRTDESPDQPLLSVVMPVFNERATVLQTIASVRAAPVDSLELIVVDDGSTDGTREALASTLSDVAGVRLIVHERNRGKGAALRSGFAAARGRFILIQDADNEYDPNDYPVLLKPLLEDHADVVFGSRFLGGPHRVLYYWHSVANTVLTHLSNMVTDLNLTDMETCYKVMRTDVLRSFTLESNGFGIEPEITAKIFKRGYRVYEIPITYAGRGYDEGKKITWTAGLGALWVLIKFRFTE
jgi:glycosyltransferase involved in cell wall biosynthesis